MNSRPGTSSIAVTATAFVLLVVMALLMGGSVRRESVTVDEIAHIGAGVSYLQKLDLRMNEEHPPLAKVLAVVPLMMRGVHADYSNLSWSFSSRFMMQYLGEWVWGHWLITRWNDSVVIVFWARMPMLLLTLAMGLVLYRLGAKLGSPVGGLLCLCAYCTMPAFLTFGPLVLTDTAVTFFSLLTLWALADLWRSPTRVAMLRLGLALGGALLSKFSAGLLFICFGAFALSLRLRALPEQPTERTELRAWRRQRRFALTQSTLLAAIVVYGVYFILSWNEPTGSFSMIPHFPASPLLRRLLMPPWLYLRGLATFAMTASRPTYILGKQYPHGVWFYFPILFLLKSPLAFIALLFFALVVAVAARKRLKESWTIIPQAHASHWRAVWVSFLVFMAACLLSRLTISIRHFFMPLVLLILLLAPLPRILDSLQRSGWEGARAGRFVVLVLALWSVVTALHAYPYYFPFLNSLSLGRPNYELVHDSNADWNQALPDVEQWVKHRGLSHVLIDEYGTSEPAVYVPQAEFWNCQQPSAADAGLWAIVSANMILESHNCPWLLRLPQEALAGGSMYAFQLPSAIPPAGSADGPPLREAWHNFAGIPWSDDFRLVILNCIRDPEKMQPTIDEMIARYRAAAQKKRDQ